MYVWVREEEEGGGLPTAYLVGLVSSGSGALHCGGANHPGLYTRVKSYLAWIKKHAASGACVNHTADDSQKKKSTTKKKKSTRKKKRSMTKKKKSTRKKKKSKTKKKKSTRKKKKSKT